MWSNLGALSLLGVTDHQKSSSFRYSKQCNRNPFITHVTLPQPLPRSPDLQFLWSSELLRKLLHTKDFSSPGIHLGFPGGCACHEGDTGDEGLIPGSGRSSGGGNGNPLQYCCLENPMDRRVWWATVYGVEKSQTWLKRLGKESILILFLHSLFSLPFSPNQDLVSRPARNNFFLL